MRIRHDKESGALYITLQNGTYDHTEDFSDGADVYMDVDAKGTVLGLEALSFDDLAIAIEERGGKLDLPDPVVATEAISIATAQEAAAAISAALTEKIVSDMVAGLGVESEGDEATDPDESRTHPRR